MRLKSLACFRNGLFASDCTYIIGETTQTDRQIDIGLDINSYVKVAVTLSYWFSPVANFLMHMFSMSVVSLHFTVHVLLVWGIHVTKWLGAQSLLLFLVPHQVGVFQNISIYTWWNLFKQSAEYAENQAVSDGVSAILQSGLIIENIRRMFYCQNSCTLSG